MCKMKFDGTKILDFRNDLKMSQENLAAKSGVSRITISALENGKQESTNTGVLVALAKALNKEVEDFFCQKS